MCGSARAVRFFLKTKKTKRQFREFRSFLNNHLFTSTASAGFLYCLQTTCRRSLCKHHCSCRHVGFWIQKKAVNSGESPHAVWGSGGSFCGVFRHGLTGVSIWNWTLWLSVFLTSLHLLSFTGDQRRNLLSQRYDRENNHNDLQGSDVMNRPSAVALPQMIIIIVD